MNPSRPTRTIDPRRLLRSFLFALGALVLLVPAAAHAEAWHVDPNHTEINFTVNHFFTPVNGSFKDFDVDLVYDPEHPESSHVKARISVASVDTGNEKRDAHLRSADWFEAEKYPDMTFESRKVKPLGENRFAAEGVLTIKGQKKDVVLPISLLGAREIPAQMQQMMGGAKEVASFKATTTLDRGDFGVGVGNWASSMIVGSDVEVEILLEADRK